MIFGPHFFSWVHFPSQTNHCNYYNPQKPEKYLLIKSVDHSIFCAGTADHVRAAESQLILTPNYFQAYHTAENILEYSPRA